MTQTFNIFISLLLFFVGALIKKNPDILGSLYRSRAKYRDVILPEIAKKVAIVLFATAGVIMLGYPLTITFKVELSELWFVVLPLLLMSIYLPCVSYFVRKKHHSKSRTLRNVYIFTVLAILIFVPLFIISKPPSIDIGEKNIEITGIYYHEYIPYNTIQEMDIIDIMPETTGQINGISVGGIKKGDFQLEGEGQASIYLQSSSSPYINIQTKGHKEYFINAQNFKHTISLYNRINSMLQKYVQCDSI